MSYAFTLAKVADPGRVAAKRIVGKSDGSVEKASLRSRRAVAFPA